MGYLERFARQQERKDKLASFRISEKKYNEFINYCDRLGLSFGEALNYLIDRELAEAAEEERDRRRKKPTT